MIRHHDLSHRPKTAAVRPTEAVLVLMVLVILTLAVVLSTPHPSERMGTTTIKVGAGDTLWKVVQAHPVPGMSTAEAASLVARMNGLEGRSLHAGDTIRVPVRLADSHDYAMR